MNRKLLNKKLDMEYDVLDPSKNNVLLEDICLNLSLMELDEKTAEKLVGKPNLLQSFLRRFLDDDDFERFLINKLREIVKEFSSTVEEPCIHDTGLREADGVEVCFATLDQKELCELMAAQSRGLLAEIDQATHDIAQDSPESAALAEIKAEIEKIMSEEYFETLEELKA